MGDYHDIHLQGDQWTPEEKVSNHDNEELVKEFTEKEVKQAVFGMEHNKAEFYQKCLEIIKGDLMNFFSDFHKGNLDIARLNYGCLVASCI